MNPKLEKLLKKANLGVSVVGKMAEILVSAKDPTPLAAVAIGAKLVSALQESLNDQRNPWEAVSDWADISSSVTLRWNTVRHLRAAGLERVVAASEGMRATEVTLYGQTMRFVVGGTWADGPYVRMSDDVEEQKLLVRAAIARFLWEYLGDNLVLSIEKDAIVLGRDVVTRSEPSGTSEALWSRLRPFLDAGYSRGVLLHGKPGTGKSYIIRDLIKRAGGRSLRVHFTEMGEISNLADIVDLLQPTAVFIDDLDYAKGLSDILVQFEAIKEVANMFLVSANNIGAFSGAALRPGRFDEVIQIDRLDDGVYDDLTGHIPDSEIRDRLRGAPVAHVNEWLLRRRLLGEDVANQELDDILNRGKA